MKYQEKDINVGAFMNKSFNNFEIIVAILKKMISEKKILLQTYLKLQMKSLKFKRSIDE